MRPSSITHAAAAARVVGPRHELVLAGETDAGALACVGCTSSEPREVWLEVGARCSRCDVPVRVAEVCASLRPLEVPR